MILTLIFYMFAGLLVLSSLAVVSAKNPVHSVLFLIFCFFNAGGLFLLQGAEFLAMLIVIVYVGAVAVLFLFVVMMLNIDFEKLRAGFSRLLPLGLALSAAMLAELLIVIQGFKSIELPVNIATKAPEITNTSALGRVIYTDYALVFELSGLILLVAMIGAIVLTHRLRDDVKRQVISQQNNRNPERAIEIVKVEPGRGV